ncbi:hypothetical protein SEMRO_2379_G325420.1 [Seminavis robusta]|uniref:Uncharacterized protein n=1 Tax=Seminavis robusta TaxID=568900 RepID=A0A9N8F266_9STRA|nr:hypothetical protein SEMRO_2379_G325420.1 [Seminavis robusta]|eukprot:Sro2379_g325420.1 n/a (200) ;mRNA; f:4424-5079
MSANIEDTRKVVGGFCWAKATQVTHDAKRFFGSNTKNTWLKGLVQEVEMRKKTPDAKRGTNYVKALYKIGDYYAKEQWICLQNLKATNPNPSINVEAMSNVEPPPPPPPPPLTNNNNNNEEQARTPPATTPPATAGPDTGNSEPEESDSVEQGSSPENPEQQPSPASVEGPQPVSSKHGYDWYAGKDPTDVPRLHSQLQ